MQLATVSASVIRPGDKIIGRREFHLTVETVSRSSNGRITFVGVNGWGEEMRMIYRSNDTIQKIISL